MSETLSHINVTIKVKNVLKLKKMPSNVFFNPKNRQMRL